MLVHAPRGVRGVRLAALHLGPVRHHGERGAGKEVEVKGIRQPGSWQTFEVAVTPLWSQLAFLRLQSLPHSMRTPLEGGGVEPPVLHVGGELFVDGERLVVAQGRQRALHLHEVVASLVKLEVRVPVVVVVVVADLRVGGRQMIGLAEVVVQQLPVEAHLADLVVDAPGG